MFWKRGNRMDRAAAKIAGFVLRVQFAFAHYMNAKTKTISTVKWKWLICLFSITWGSLSIYSIMQSFKTERPVAGSRYKKIEFIAPPPRNDSLVLLERIYKQRKMIKHP